MDCMTLVGRARDRRYRTRSCPNPAVYEYQVPSAIGGMFKKQTCTRHTPQRYRTEANRVGAKPRLSR